MTEIEKPYINGLTREEIIKIRAQRFYDIESGGTPIVYEERLQKRWKGDQTPLHAISKRGL